MTTEAVVAKVFQYLRSATPEEVATWNAVEVAKATEQVKQDELVAENEKETIAAAEQARAEAQAKADALAAEQRAVTEKKLDQTILAKAKAGDAEAQYLIGRAYSYGTGGAAKSDVDSIYWFRKSAEQGNAKGENALGASYEYGNGVGKDYIQAVALLRKAADQGNPKAENNLADAYYNGWGMQKDLSLAIDLYRKAATAGEANAEFSLGYMYSLGEGTEQDYTKAASWYRKSAEQGNDSAQLDLGWLYENGKGVPKNEALAKSWYQKAANLGNSQAKSNLDILARSVRLAANPPQVTNHDGFVVFRDQIYDYERFHLSDLNRETNPVNIHPYDAHNQVIAEYRASQTDQQRALLLALIAVRASVTFTPKQGNSYTQELDGADLADQATSEAVATYHYTLWNAETEADRNVDGLNAAVTKYSEWTVRYGGKATPLNQAIAMSANELLRAAYSGPHRTGDLNSFITTYVIPSGEGTSLGPIKVAATTLGFK